MGGSRFSFEGRATGAGPFLLFLLGAVAAVPPAFATSEAGGFSEVRLSAFPGADGDQWQVVERLRLTFEAEVGDRLVLVTTLEVGLTQGRDQEEETRKVLEQSDLASLLAAQSCGGPDYDNDFLRIDDAGDYLEVDRLYLDAYRAGLDLRLGRQAIHWGSAQFLNPTDPFPEVLLAEPWRPRRGINAVRATVPFGSHDAAVVAGTDDDLEHLRAGARVRFNRAGVDAALVGAFRGDADDGFVGVDLRGTYGVGWWVEAAYHPVADPFGQLAVGIDYSFSVLERLIVTAQYFRNGAGATDSDDYDRATGLTDCAALTGEPADPFAPFTLARDYLLLAAAAEVVADLSVNLTVLQNLNDGTALAVPTLGYAVTDWLEVSASSQLPLTVWGDGGEFDPRREDLIVSADTGTETVTADLSGLVPDAVMTLWVRASY